MATETTSTVIGLFATQAAAQSALDALLEQGYSRDQFSLITADQRNRASHPDIGPIEQVGSGTDAGTGAAIGGIAGFIGGVVALAIPGIGPILAAGPLAAGIMGAGIGAATGGVIGALKSYGVPESDASRFSDAVRRGSVMLTAHIPSDRVDEVSGILDRSGAMDVDEPAERIPAGAITPPLPAPAAPAPPDVVEAGRLKPGESLVERQRDRERRVYVYPGITGSGGGPHS